MRVQLADSDQPHAQSAAVRFGGLGRRYILVVSDDRPEGLLSHADGSGLLPEARPKLTALSWEEIRLALMLQEEPSRFSPREDTIKPYELWQNTRRAAKAYEGRKKQLRELLDSELSWTEEEQAIEEGIGSREEGSSISWEELDRQIRGKYGLR
jgi:hypothetical protein